MTDKPQTPDKLYVQSKSIFLLNSSQKLKYPYNTQFVTGAPFD